MENFAPETYFELKSFHLPLWEDISYVWEIFPKLGDYLCSLTPRIDSFIHPTVYLKNRDNIFIASDVLIEPGAYLEGPCCIGRGSVVRHGACLRKNVLIGENCIVGHGTEVKNSIFFDGSHAAHFSYVGDSILGRRVNLGAGTKCSNFRLDGGEIYLLTDEGVVKTSLRKLGAIIGDGVQTGCNCVLNPGTFIGKETLCYPLLNLRGIIPPHSIVKNKNGTLIREKKNPKFVSPKL